MHKRSHTGEKPYSCNICNKAYNSSSKLTRHNKSAEHLEKMTQFSFVQCGNEIIIKQEIPNEEIKPVEEIKPYPCDICNLRFKTRKSLKSHYKCLSHINNGVLALKKASLSSIGNAENLSDENLKNVSLRYIGHAENLSDEDLENAPLTSIGNVENIPDNLVEEATESCARSPSYPRLGPDTLAALVQRPFSLNLHCLVPTNKSDKDLKNVSLSSIDNTENVSDEEVKNVFLSSIDNAENISEIKLEIIKEETMDETDFIVNKLTNEDEEMIPFGVECKMEIIEETDDS